MAQPRSTCMPVQDMALTSSCSTMQAYFAVADRLRKNVEVKAVVMVVTKDLLQDFPEEQTMAHRTLKRIISSEPW